MTPQQIETWLEANLHRFDGPAQYLGDEPNAPRKSWDEHQVRWLIAASWPYFHGAGNQSVPAVCQVINDHPESLADRFYLPQTPRDFRLLEKAGVPVFGIESKHPAADFDVVGTSISYTVLFMNFCRYLTASKIPLRWADRQKDPGKWPMVMVGGQSYCAPGSFEPVADCVFLGEAEDEQGNGGLGRVCDRIAMFKAEGTWQSDRITCYARLAREFNYLYFPRFVDVIYDLLPAEGLEHSSKQVVGFASKLPGMVMPFRARHVIDMDAIEPLRSAPLLFGNPSMGAGDLEVARGCTCWCSFPLRGDTLIITKDGTSSLDYIHAAGVPFEVWDGQQWKAATIDSHGVQAVQRVVFRPADRGTSNGAWRRSPRARRRVEVVATPHHGWELVDGTETHQLRAGDFIPAAAALSEGPDYDLGWVHGFLFGDGHQRKTSTGERRSADSGSFKVRLFGKDQAARDRFELFLDESQGRSSWSQRPPLYVSSIANPDWAEGDTVVYGWSNFNLKGWPSPAADPVYLEGFVAGWMCADGSERAKGTSWRIAASHIPENHGEQTPHEWLSRHAAAAGWVYVGFSESTATETNFGPRSAPLLEYTLARPQNRGWCVESIEPLDRPTEVFCLTVPGSHRFALASGALTMNCRLTWVSKPYRQRTVDMSVAQAKRWMLAMGSNELSPFSPDFPVYTRKNALLAALLGEVSDEIDTTAMRVDDFIDDRDYVLLQAFGGADAVTLGLEGNSQRMRDLVGKGISDGDVLEAFTVGLRAGFRKFKFFMITNLPGEEPGDVMRIVRLGRRLAAVRDQFGQPNVLIQFSWTPLLIEAQTPFQWFAPTPPDHTLIDVGDALRDLKIQFKIGTKAEPNKVAFFQLAQRASRDVGEAIVDAIEKLNVACWGGVPKTMRAELETALIARGFLNGFGDCFGERYRHDMFGWEFISTGVSPDLLWEAYRQMVEFLEGTDADTYDEEAGPEHRGQEWIGRCDSTCLGRSCGACKQADFRKRREYVRDAASEALVDLSRVSKIDLSAQAQRLRVRMEIAARYRFSGPKFWHHLVRRAAYRAAQAEPELFLGKVTGLPPGTNIAKRSVRLASDQVKVTDWCHGADYADFALTRHLTGQQGLWLLEVMGRELAPWCEFGNVFIPYPAGSPISEDCTGFYEIESHLPLDVLREKLARWEDAETVPMRLAADESYFGLATEDVDAKELLRDIWVIPGDEGQLKVRMLLGGKAGPYQAYAAFTGSASWLALGGQGCRRLEWFDAVSGSITDEECWRCAQDVPVSVIGFPWAGGGYCPRCNDEEEGQVLAGLSEESRPRWQVTAR